MYPIPTTTSGLGYEDIEETIVYADWVECSALFQSEIISKADVQDCFSEIDSFDNEITPLKVADIWSEMERRRLILKSSYPLIIKENRIMPRSWKDHTAYSFCLLISYSKSCREWMNNYCRDFQMQGELFEHISEAALNYLFKNWKVGITGWSKNNPVSIKKIIMDIATELGESIGKESPRPVDKDGGIDILCYRKFSDLRGNYPVFFIQCATGSNWTNKRMENTLNLWNNWIQFKAKNLITRGFAVPFAFDDETFRQTQMRGDCLVLDRLRLLAHEVPESEWMPKNTNDKITSWIEKKYKTIEV